MSTSDLLPLPAYTIDEAYRVGVARMQVSGFFDLGTLERHFADNEAFVRRWRAAGKPVRVLIDAVELKPHSPEGQNYVQTAVKRIYQPGDRVAILVASSLVKMQMRRTHSLGEIINLFVSEHAALTWLTVQD